MDVVILWECRPCEVEAEGEGAPECFICGRRMMVKANQEASVSR